MNSLAIQSKVTGPVKNPNYKFIYVQLARLIILFPFFSIKNAGLYANSGLWPLFFLSLHGQWLCRLKAYHLFNQPSIYRENQLTYGFQERRTMSNH